MMALLLFACTSEQPAASGSKGSQGAGSSVSGSMTRPGTTGVGGAYSLELLPREATRKSTLSLQAAGFDLANARIEWLVNGRPVTTSVPSQFSASDVEKGAEIQAKASIQGLDVLSNSVKILNAYPELAKVKILPEVFKPGDRLNIESAGSDVDGDRVAVQCEWTRNGEPAGNGESIEGALKRGDKISVKITPYDGEAYGSSIVLNREIRNMPPVIAEHKEFNFDGAVYSCPIKASDPDGDPLTYSLQSPLADMTIDSSTGQLKWTVPKEFIGKKSVVVVVNDGNGGTANYPIEISIQSRPSSTNK
jgi:hypothetical protein